jgi:hypothetical protein
MTTPDFRALCAELVYELDAETGYIRRDGQRITNPAVVRARTALAAEAVGPSDDQIIGHAIAVGLAFQPDDRPEVYLPFSAEDDPIDDLLIAFARAVLARWGSAPRPIPALKRLPDGAQTIEPSERTLLVPVPQPVSVSERWPGFSDCDDAERVWCWSWALQTWRLSRIKQAIHTHWLPAPALPTPAQEGAE